jgi:hypothetical protein
MGRLDLRPITAPKRSQQIVAILPRDRPRGILALLRAVLALGGTPGVLRPADRMDGSPHPGAWMA